MAWGKVSGAWSRWFKSSNWQASRRFQSYLKYQIGSNDTHFWVDYETHIHLSGSHGLTTVEIPQSISATGQTTRSGKKAFKYDKGTDLVVLKGRFTWVKEATSKTVTVSETATWKNTAKYVDKPRVSSNGFKSTASKSFTVPAVATPTEEDLTLDDFIVTITPEPAIRADYANISVGAPRSVVENETHHERVFDFLISIEALDFTSTNPNTSIFIPFNAPDSITGVVSGKAGYVVKDNNSTPIKGDAPGYYIPEITPLPSGATIVKRDLPDKEFTIQISHPPFTEVSPEIQDLYLIGTNTVYIASSLDDNNVKVFLAEGEAYVYLEKISYRHYRLPDGWENPVKLKLFFIVSDVDTSITKIAYYKGELRERN